MEKLTEEEIFSRQTVVLNAYAAARDRCKEFERGTPEQRAWTAVRYACVRESGRLARLARLAARKRVEQSA